MYLALCSQGRSPSRINRKKSRRKNPQKRLWPALVDGTGTGVAVQAEIVSLSEYILQQADGSAGKGEILEIEMVY
jgi:hypothetical protein